ncbi:MAG: hypothetical protein HY054_03660 [Proteobacteria bacterium]|nr:hypothetical protein [Pseudomonadota bacterium]
MDPIGLLNVLAYKRQVLSQLLGVASIFGGFAVTGVVALRADTHSGRVQSIAFLAMIVAAVAFIFATAFDSVWLPMSNSAHSPESVRALLAAGDNIAYAVIIGVAALAVAVALLGFARSRLMGIATLMVALLAIVAFVVEVTVLVETLR